VFLDLSQHTKTVCWVRCSWHQPRQNGPTYSRHQHPLKLPQLLISLACCLCPPSVLADAALLWLLLLASCRAAIGSLQLVISAAGKNFCAGLDLSYLTDTFGSKMQPGSSSSSSSSSSCPARTRYSFRQDILQMQVGRGCCCHTIDVACSPAAAFS
jgi:hypothetical protein